MLAENFTQPIKKASTDLLIIQYFNYIFKVRILNICHLRKVVVQKGILDICYLRKTAALCPSTHRKTE